LETEIEWDWEKVLELGASLIEHALAARRHIEPEQGLMHRPAGHHERTAGGCRMKDEPLAADRAAAISESSGDNLGTAEEQETMGARGPKSAAAMAVVSPITSSRPAPPPELTEAEADEWRSIVGRLPQHWFPKETHGLLAAFLKHQSTHRVLCGLIEGFDVTVLRMDLGVHHYDKLLVMRERESRAMATLAVKLRLTNQSRYTPATAARQAQQPFGFIDEGGRLRPWQMHT
jgi:hypothetical protein